MEHANALFFAAGIHDDGSPNSILVVFYIIVCYFILLFSSVSICIYETTGFPGGARISLPKKESKQ